MSRLSTDRLLVLLPGLGAVSTTFIAGVEAIRQGHTKAYGSVTQMQTIRLGSRSENRNPLVRDFLPLAPLANLAFAGWDVFPENAFEAASKAGVLRLDQLRPVEKVLREIEPMKAAFQKDYVKRLDGTHIKKWKTKSDLAEALREDIRESISRAGAARAVMIWCGSTEVYLEPAACHQSVEAFEKGLMANDEAIAPSQIYAYAAIQEGVPYANGAPNLSADFPALEDLARERGIPIAGKDFKTGPRTFFSETILSSTGCLSGEHLVLSLG